MKMLDRGEDFDEIMKDIYKKGATDMLAYLVDRTFVDRHSIDQIVKDFSILVNKAFDEEG